MEFQEKLKKMLASGYYDSIKYRYKDLASAPINIILVFAKLELKYFSSPYLIRNCLLREYLYQIALCKNFDPSNIDAIINLYVYEDELKEESEEIFLEGLQQLSCELPPDFVAILSFLNYIFEKTIQDKKGTIENMYSYIFKIRSLFEEYQEFFHNTLSKELKENLEEIWLNTQTIDCYLEDLVEWNETNWSCTEEDLEDRVYEEFLQVSNKIKYMREVNQ